MDEGSLIHAGCKVVRNCPINVAPVSCWVHHKPSALKQHMPSVLLARLREQRRIYQSRFTLPHKRWLICRPRGGLNDTLCQIHKSIVYSFRHQRIVLIDTTKAGLCDEFSNYFQTVFPFATIHCSLEPGKLKELDERSCYPNGFQGRLGNYELIYSPEAGNYIDTKSGQRPGISWNENDHSEEVMLNEQTGGGYGYLALPYFRFTNEASKHIVNRLSQIPNKYIAMIIRHSDVRLDYREFLKASKPLIDGQDVLVSTDSHEALTYARSYLDNARIYDVADVPDVQGQTLLNTPGVTSRKIILGCLTQLIGLSRAEKIMIPAGDNVYPSGFTQLAMSLSGRNDLIQQLLGENMRTLNCSGDP